MAQILRITGWPGTGSMSMAQLAPFATDTVTAGPLTFTENGTVSGYFDSTDLGGIAAGWYRGIDSGGQPWWFNVGASGTFVGQKDLPPTISVNHLSVGDIDGYTLEEAIKLCLAALAGKLSGAGGTTITIRAADDSKDRITATVDANGNRSAITLDGAG